MKGWATVDMTGSTELSHQGNPSHRTQGYLPEMTLEVKATLPWAEFSGMLTPSHLLVQDSLFELPE